MDNKYILTNTDINCIINFLSRVPVGITEKMTFDFIANKLVEIEKTKLDYLLVVIEDINPCKGGENNVE